MKTKFLITIIVVLCAFLFLSACTTNYGTSGEKTTDNAASVNEVQSGNGNEQETQTKGDTLVPPPLPN